ncbi:MAG TPA: ribonuclease J [Hyphomicrobiaceae bacterium]|nr:ribonuclease J [Hyphomicrobiaceae bacterium]
MTDQAGRTRTNDNARMNATTGELVFTALGGLGEIGMNVYLYGIGPADDRRWLMVDLGLTFPGENEPGVDVVLPDLRFIEAEKSALAGIIITHAHEDHIGAVLDMWPRLKAPLYATPFTAGMLKAKIAEFGGRERPRITEVKQGSRFNIAPFDVELVSMSHSIPETSGLILRTPHGTVFHTADWKLDPDPLIGETTDEAKIKALGDEGVTALICDSTNAFRAGTSPSEAEVSRSLATIIAGAKRRVAITTFASNVARIKAVADAAAATGRQLVVAGRSLHRVIQVAIDTGYLPEDFKYVDQQRFSHIPPNETVALITGSQGEPRAAMARIAMGEHRDIKLSDGDLVIYSSRSIPGNEKGILDIQNRLAGLGCKVMTDADGLVHVTGHPRREELKSLFGWVRPKVLVPMHGEVRHLQENARLAREAGIPAVRTIVNGELIRLAPGKSEVIDDVPVGRYFRDGRLIIAESEGSVRERRKLSVVGLVAVGLAITPKGEVLGDIDVALDGIPVEDAEGELMEDIVLDAVDGTLDSIPAKRRRDVEVVREAVRRSVRAAVDRAWGKKPIVKVLMSIVSD